MPKHNSKWSDHFRRVKDDALGRPSFYLKGTKPELCDMLYFLRTHEIYDKVISICASHKFPARALHRYPHMSIFISGVFYGFLDGGLDVFSGNDVSGDPGQGAYVRGFNSFRWLLYQLDLIQPRVLRGESAVPNDKELDEMLDVVKLPFVADSRFK